jgi:hypothetical protein
MAEPARGDEVRAQGDAARVRRRRTGLLVAVAVTALLAVYVGAVALRGVQLVATGKPVGVGLGLAVLVLPLLVIYLIVRELLLAGRVQGMADELAAAGALPVDDLPRSPGGRVDREAARERFATAREDAEATSDDWAVWYRLAFAYDAAGDRRRARAALRTADRLHRGRPA